MCVCVTEDRLESYSCLCFLLQNLLRTQKARRTTKRRALNSASEKIGLTTTTHQTLLNYLKWSIIAPMGRAQGASAQHELLKSPQIEYKCELMKTGLFFFFCLFSSFFAVKGIVDRVVLQGCEATQQTAHSYALESLGMLQNLEVYSFYLITYFSSLQHS